MTKIMINTKVGRSEDEYSTLAVREAGQRSETVTRGVWGRVDLRSHRKQKERVGRNNRVANQTNA